MDFKFIKFIWVPQEDNFVLEWMQELGWGSDPFEDRVPDNVNETIGGYATQRSKLNLFIINEFPFGILKGSHGSGKTTLLHWLANELELHGSRVIPIVVNVDTIKEPNQLIALFAKKTTGFFGRLFGQHKKVTTRHDLIRHMKRSLGRRRLVILVDDINHAAKETISIFRQFVDEKVPLQMIIAGTKKDVEKSPLTKLGSDQLHVHLDGLKEEGTMEMVRKRIEHVGGEGLHPFTEKVLLHMHKQAHGNPRMILRECHKLAIKSTVNKKLHKPKKEEKQPPSPKPVVKEKALEKKFASIKEKITTIDYAKKKQQADVKEKDKKPHRKVDVDEKEKNDRLIHELFDTK